MATILSWKGKTSHAQIRYKHGAMTSMMGMDIAAGLARLCIDWLTGAVGMAGDRWVVAGQCSERSNSNIFPCNIANKMQWVWFLFLCVCFFFFFFFFFFNICIYIHWSTCKIWHGAQCILIKLCTLIFFFFFFFTRF